MCPQTQTQTKIKQAYICFSWFISSFALLQTSKFAADLIQGLLVKAWKGYHIRIARILAPKTEKDVEVLQSAKTFDKTPILNIFEILTQTAFLKKQDDQNQLTVSLICQHITQRICNIINSYMMNKVLLVK